MNVRAAVAGVLAFVALACGGGPPRDAGTERARSTSTQHPTFTKDIAPILDANCVTCHRPGQVAPFSLIDYDVAKAHADDIASATGARKMPPWMPAPGEYEFLGARRLRDDQIALIRRWVETGAAEGDRAARPPLPPFPDGWQLGTPDLVVTLERAFTLRPGTGDRYRQLVFPLSMPAARYVRAVEFRPGPAPVHHAVIRVDRTHASRRLDGADGQPGFEGVMAPDVKNPDGHFVGWTPGQGPIVAPAGMPWRLERGSDLVVEAHMIPGATVQAVQPTIGLFFTDMPPRDSPVELLMGVKTLDIPAGERGYRATDRYTFPVDVTLLGLYPHAHYLAHDVQVAATFPDGTTKRLLHIPRWDFHWQQEYRFATPVTLPAGTTIAMEYRYDNSSQNDDNPSRPPRRVTWGLKATDEMANLSLQVLPRSKAAGRLLARAFLERARQASMASAEMRVRIEPGNAMHHLDLGKSYVEAGRTAAAIPALESALRLNAQLPLAHDYLGRALFAERRTAEAFTHLERAVALVPNDEVFHIDLAKVLVETGRAADGLRAFERAIAINPEYGQAHEGLGVTLVRLGRFNDAIAAFQRAVAVAPESAAAENGLAVALAQAGRMEEALQHVRRALDLDPDFTPARDNLARMSKGR
jgi:tetratricopeptide (TPR) repeat protein/mono/diheme cytochrome c family protein